MLLDTLNFRYTYLEILGLLEALPNRCASDHATLMTVMMVVYFFFLYIPFQFHQLMLLCLDSISEPCGFLNEADLIQSASAVADYAFCVHIIGNMF